MSFDCFIIFVSRLLDPMLLLAFRSEIGFTSSTVVGVIKKVKLFGFFKKLEKCFFVGRMFFCNFFANTCEEIVEMFSNMFLICDCFTILN